MLQQQIASISARIIHRWITIFTPLRLNTCMQINMTNAQGEQQKVATDLWLLNSITANDLYG